MRSSKLNRREFLRLAGAGTASLAAGCSGWPVPASSEISSASRIALSMGMSAESVLPGPATQVMKFHGKMVTGSAGTSLQIPPGSYIGPLIRTRQNEVLDIDVKNDLNEMSVVHWHGLDNPPQFDGHPHQAVKPHSAYKVRLPIVNRAGTYWYHPHPDKRTGIQVYSGLIGMIVVSDEEEQALALPRLEYDVPLILQDRTFGAANELVYRMDMPNGMLGDRSLVNGRPDYVFSAATRVYRFRILNAANARIYKLAWDHALPMVVIATDGGLLRQPAIKKYVTLSPGERVEIWADFSQIPVGREVKLSSLEFSGTGSVRGPKLQQGTSFEVMRVRIDRAEKETLKLPATLSTYESYNVKDAVNRSDPRRFIISRNGDDFLLNGGFFDPHLVAPNERIRLGDLELWEFVFNNPSGKQHLAHPIHIHGPQFQVLERTIDRSRRQGWESVRAGYTDEGWKDTFLLMPGEGIRILIRFHRYTGMSMYHCHNLEHEDMGMMRNLSILDKV